MHLVILGLILVVGILVYYIMTTSPGSGKSSDAKKDKIKRHKSDEDEESRVPEDLRKEGNVVFLPSLNKDSAATNGDDEIAGSDDQPDDNA
ncbi:MAG: hypothetical protein IJH41_06070 [Eubacterium sp.]|nr:hypothetical protein [Eubacterium sp.]